MAPSRIFLRSITVSFTPYPALVDSMPYYASSSPQREEYPSLVLSSAPNSPTYNRSRIDDASFLSSDLDVSFASVSVASPPMTPTDELDEPTSMIPGRLIQPSPSAMDISPAHPPPGTMARLAVAAAAGSTMPIRRPRSNTTGAQRLVFAKGAEPEKEHAACESSSPAPGSAPAAPIINRSIKTTPVAPPIPSLLEPKASGSTKPPSARRRTGLPSLWMQDAKPGAPKSKRAGGIFAVSRCVCDQAAVRQILIGHSEHRLRRGLASRRPLSDRVRTLWRSTAQCWLRTSRPSSPAHPRKPPPTVTISAHSSS